MPEPYDILGVDAGATEAAIKAAFRRAAKRCHPDMNAGHRGGERRLRRLIAARDFLLSHGRRFSNRKPAGPRLILGAAKDRRPFLFAGAVAGAGFLFFFFLMPHVAAPFRFAAAPVQPWATEEVEDPAIPDEGSAEVKAIRDLRESTGTKYLRPQLMTHGPARDKATAPSPVLQHHAPRFKKVVTGGAATMTKAWRRLASKLGGP